MTLSDLRQAVIFILDLVSCARMSRALCTWKCWGEWWDTWTVKQYRKQAIDTKNNMHDLKGRMLSVKNQSPEVTHCKISFAEHAWNKIIKMENRVVVGRGVGWWVGGSGYGYKDRALWRRVVLYLNCDGGYTNPYNTYNNLHRTTHTYTHTLMSACNTGKIWASSGDYTVSVFEFWDVL